MLRFSFYYSVITSIITAYFDKKKNVYIFNVFTNLGLSDIVNEAKLIQKQFY